MKEDCLPKEIKYNETPKHNPNASLFQVGSRREFRPKQNDVNNFSEFRKGQYIEPFWVHRREANSLNKDGVCKVLGLIWASLIEKGCSNPETIAR